jgi:hypothetical protein
MRRLVRELSGCPVDCTWHCSDWKYARLRVAAADRANNSQGKKVCLFRTLSTPQQGPELEFAISPAILSLGLPGVIDLHHSPLAKVQPVLSNPRSPP